MTQLKQMLKDKGSSVISFLSSWLLRRFAFLPGGACTQSADDGEIVSPHSDIRNE